MCRPLTRRRGGTDTKLCGVTNNGEGTFDPSGIYALAAMLTVPTESILTTLILDGNNLAFTEDDNEQSEGVDALAKALITNKTLRYLSLKDTHLGPECAVGLADAMSRSSSLITVNLLYNGFAEEGIGVLTGIYQRSTILQSVCGLTKGATQVMDLPGSGLECTRDDAMLIAAELTKGVTTQSLAVLNLSGEVGH
jgi:hypothetical protein